MSLRTSGDVIKDLRLKNGLSQIQFAHMLGYRDRTAISKLESGENHIPTSRIAEVAEKLGVSEKYLNNELETVLYALGVTITYLGRDVLVEDGRTAGRLRFSTDTWERLKDDSNPRFVFDLLRESAGADATAPNSPNAPGAVIGQRMKNRRKELGYSAEYVANCLGVSPATIYRYEKGDIEKVPSDILAPLAHVLRTTPKHLMGWDGAEGKTLEPTVAAASDSAARVSLLYDRANARDQRLVDTVLEPYDDGTIAVQPIRPTIILCDTRGREDRASV